MSEIKAGIRKKVIWNNNVYNLDVKITYGSCTLVKKAANRKSEMRPSNVALSYKDS